MIIIFGLEQDLRVFLPQNRFQALLNEIIQQEEREMEQVKVLLFFKKKNNYQSRRDARCKLSTAFITSTQFVGENIPAHSACCPLFTLIFMPNSKVQIQPCATECVSCYQRGPFLVVFFFLLFFCVHAQRPPTAVSFMLFVLTNEGSKLMWKDVLIIIHLPSNYTRGLLAINHTLFFSLPLSLLLSSVSIARLPAGATWLAGREVTTRGQPHVSVSHE